MYEKFVKTQAEKEHILTHYRLEIHQLQNKKFRFINILLTKNQKMMFLTLQIKSMESLLLKSGKRTCMRYNLIRYYKRQNADTMRGILHTTVPF